MSGEITAGDVHVHPLGDLIAHDLTADCVCGPDCELVEAEHAPDRWLVIHHSLDGREKAES